MNICERQKLIDEKTKMMKARAKEMEYREVAKKAEPIQKKK